MTEPTSKQRTITRILGAAMSVSIAAVAYVVNTGGGGGAIVLTAVAAVGTVAGTYAYTRRIDRANRD